MPAVPTRGTMSRWSRARPGSGCRRSSMAGKRRNTARSPTTLPFLVSSTADIADAPWWARSRKSDTFTTTAPDTAASARSRTRGKKSWNDITREAWERVQEILDGRQEKKHRKVTHDFAVFLLLP